MIQEKKTFTRPLSSKVFDSLPEEAQLYIQFLETQISLLATQVADLSRKVCELERRLAKDSSNSSKPPGSDGLRKPPPKTLSLRGKFGKKPGGQPGHVGKTLEQVVDPDNIEIYRPSACENCQNSLSDVSASGVETRQVFDLPVIVVQVTEHQAEIKHCPCCGHKSKGVFPDNVKAPVQYGERIQALIAYLQHQHFIPPERVSQLFEDIFDIPLSPGTCSNVDKRLFKNLEGFETSLKAYLLASRILHFDETGFRCEKKLCWVHVTSSSLATFYQIHAKRGCEALDAIEILPHYTGVAIHDHWFPYFTYEQVKHGLCNAHHLRELKYVYEIEKSEWAKKMTDLLLEANKIADKAREQGQEEIDPHEIKKIEREYENILLAGAELYLGFLEQEEEVSDEGFGRAGLNLFKRLLRKMKCVLAFIYDLKTPFTNNQAEQDIRMLKVKQKISGCHRSFQGGIIFCRIRSYISTARKQRWGIWEALVDGIRGSPRQLILASS